MKEKTESTISQKPAINSSKAVSSGSSAIDDRLLPHFTELRNLMYESLLFLQNQFFPSQLLKGKRVEDWILL